MNQIAAEAGLSQSMISRLESNPRNPTLDSLLRVADVLELNLGTVIQQALENVADATAPKARRTQANKAKVGAPKQNGPRTRQDR